MLCFSHVSKRFGVVQALADCSFSVRRALLHEPELVVLDEPFAGFDPVAVRTLAVAS